MRKLKIIYKHSKSNPIYENFEKDIKKLSSEYNLELVGNGCNLITGERDMDFRRITK